MRDLSDLDHLRDTSKAVIDLYGSAGDGKNGRFFVPSESSPPLALCVLASVGGGWDHVSVSLPDRCPTWAEMEQIKRLFFKKSEVAMQLHVTEDNHISQHPYCLHLWRPKFPRRIPLPPGWMVGVKQVEAA